MNQPEQAGLPRNKMTRMALAVAGVAGVAWAVAVFPTFSTELPIIDVGKAVMAGEAFKPGVLSAVDTRAGNGAAGVVRPAVLGKAAVIRLRLAEDAIRAGDKSRVDQSLQSLAGMIDESLQNAPSDPFSWLARFWLDNTRHGLQPSHLRELWMSYDLGRYEGWIAAKRNRVALGVYSEMPSDLAEQAISEFVNLVRWGIAEEAADIAAGPGLLLRSVLFARLKDLKVDQRRPFAQAIYRRELDDVPVPGIDPPSPQIPMPVFPPGF